MKFFSSVALHRPAANISLLIAMALLGSGCSSSSGSDSPAPVPGKDQPDIPPPPVYVADDYPPRQEFAQRCVKPREGVDPRTGNPWLDVQGTEMDEKMWLRSMTHELYYWTDQLPDLDPADYSVEEYFYALTVPQDPFAQTMSYERFLASSENSKELSYGAIWSFTDDAAGIITARVAFVEPASEAVKSVKRGDYIVTVDDIDVASGQQDASIRERLGKIFYAPEPGETHVFGIRDADSGEIREVTLTAEFTERHALPTAKVLNTATGPVGYMLFNSHNATSEALLIDTIGAFRDAAVNDVVVDLRFNQGGYLEVAAQLAYMVTGPAVTEGVPFETPVFNSFHPQFNPVTDEPLTPLPFYQETLGFGDVEPGQPLPYLGLDRVFVLTSSATCSASESFINGLKGADVEVIQIGDATCGKPYGYIPVENCGNTYLTVMFVGENAKGFSGYQEHGFWPTHSNAATDPDENPGCVDRNFSIDQPLGDSTEDLLGAALHYRANNTCPTEEPDLGGAQPAAEQVMKSWQAHSTGEKLRLH